MSKDQSATPWRTLCGGCRAPSFCCRAICWTLSSTGWTHASTRGTGRASGAPSALGLPYGSYQKRLQSFNKSESRSQQVTVRVTVGGKWKEKETILTTAGASALLLRHVVGRFDFDRNPDVPHRLSYSTLSLADDTPDGCTGWHRRSYPRSHLPMNTRMTCTVGRTHSLTCR